VKYVKSFPSHIAIQWHWSPYP